MTLNQIEVETIPQLDWVTRIGAKIIVESRRQCVYMCVVFLVHRNPCTKNEGESIMTKGFHEEQHLKLVDSLMEVGLNHCALYSSICLILCR